MLLTQTMAWMQDFAGAPPVLQGGATPGRAFKTATGVGTAQNNAQLPLQQMVRLCETDVWEPMLEGFWLLDQRFATEDVLLESGGLSLAKPGYLEPGSLYGEYKFRWLASTQASNQQVMAQAIQGLVQLLANPGVMQVLQQERQPKKVELSPLIDRLIRSYGLRDTERVLVDGVSVPSDTVTPDPSAPQPGAPTGALNPLQGAQGQDASGEFGAMRMGANDIAAHLGQLGAPGGVLSLPNGTPATPEMDFGLPFEGQ
jgi:hypothetical protein